MSSPEEQDVARRFKSDRLRVILRWWVVGLVTGIAALLATILSGG